MLLECQEKFRWPQNISHKQRSAQHLKKLETRFKTQKQPTSKKRKMSSHSVIRDPTLTSNTLFIYTL